MSYVLCICADCQPRADGKLLIDRCQHQADLVSCDSILIDGDAAGSCTVGNIASPCGPLTLIALYGVYDPIGPDNDACAGGKCTMRRD